VEPQDRHADELAISRAGSRRTLLKGMIGGFACLASRRLLAVQKGQVRGPAHDDAEIGQVEQQAKKAGLGRFEVTRTEHFLALGDAPPPFQREALRRCEALSEAFLAYFRGCGFPLEYPAGRLTVILLKDGESYAKLLGDAPGKDVGGHYDLDTNRLVMFDFRPEHKELGEQAERVNLFTLVHETAHQLSFNTGMLNRRSDLPLWALEGLATYVEMWRPGIKGSIGGENLPRLRALRESEDWIPIADLLADDKAFQPQTEQLAYAESWLLVHFMLRSVGRRARFRNFLTQAQGVKKPDRLRIAEKTLGPLDRLEREVKHEAQKYFSR
jgi:Protein of unknown function (DUF1570)